MDETTKVMIATVSGFVIAFFAEPVKLYFQNEAKLKNLRLALYKEILYNYFTLKDLDHLLGENELVRFMEGFGIRTECYKNAIQNEISLFYQLWKSYGINILEGRYLGVMADMRKMSSREESVTEMHKNFLDLSKTFQSLVLIGFWIQHLDRKVLKKLLTPEQYQEWMRDAKDEYERNYISSGSKPF